MDEQPALRDDWRHLPLRARLRVDSPYYDEIIERHDAAMASGLASYPDPLSGFSVFTADFLAKRRYCCASGCRHCPYADTDRAAQ